MIRTFFARQYFDKCPFMRTTLFRTPFEPPFVGLSYKFLRFSWDMRRIFQQTFETRSEFCIGWVFFISSRSQCNHVLSTTGASTVCSRLPLEIRKINKTGTSKVGAISKAQKAQSFLLCPGCIHEKL